MQIVRYTCTSCGLVTRAQEGQDYRACRCEAQFECIKEDDVPTEEPQ